MTGPVRELLTRSTLRTAQPVPEGRPYCWRDHDHDDGAACALAYTPKMQEDLLSRSPGCEGCWAGVNAAWCYYHFRQRRVSDQPGAGR